METLGSFSHEKNKSEAWDSECGPQSCSVSISQEVFRNVES